MTSNPDDDTLPIQGFSQDLSIDITVDEDFIPASQPHSNESSKATKKSESSPKCDDIDKEIPNERLSVSTIETSVLPNVTLENDRSADFIPETETKKRKMDHTKEESTCRKKIQIDENLMKCTEDLFDGQADSSWNLEPMKGSESLVLETQEVAKVPESPMDGTEEPTKVPESPQNISAFNVSFPNVDKVDNKTSTPALSLPVETEKRNELSITEIIVNDSAETIDLDTSENLSFVQEKKPERKVSVEKIDVSSSFASDAERFEETQIFDHSSALMFERTKDNEKPQISTISQNMYLQETIENVDFECKAEDKTANGLDLPAVAELSKELSEEPVLDSSDQQNGDIVFKNKPNAASTAKNSPETVNSNFLQTKKMEFKLSVSCMVTMNIKTKEVVQKLILNVKEIQKYKPKPTYIEHISDSTCDKSKRSSMSSSGSVYSDKIGLPFALPKRVSAVSDQTDASDSSEEGFSKRLKEGTKVLGRTPWSNEYLLPLKMDDLMKISFEEQDLPNRQNGLASPSKQRNANCNGTHHLKEILESSSSEETSICNGEEQTSKSDIAKRFQNFKKDKEIPEINDNILEKVNEENVSTPRKGVPEEHEKSTEEPPNLDSSEIQKEAENLQEAAEDLQEGVEDVQEAVEDVQEEVEGVQEEVEDVHETAEDVVPEPGGDDKDHNQDKEKELTENLKDDEDDNSPIMLCNGLMVMARWTDKRYYSGSLFGTPSCNRWMIKFDDGTTKKINESFIIPAKWLKKGELVFVLINDQYASGKIVDIKPDQETPYVVELDSKSKRVSAKLSDICLTEVMAGIVKEKHKPFLTPGGKGSSEIDFDNVVCGKRLREPRTPTCQTESGPKKKSSSKGNKESLVKETPQRSEKKNTSGKTNGLKNENGHLVEDKIISTDSPSGNEAGETPFRSGGSRETRVKTSLSYESKDKTQTTPKLSDWLAPDGTPIPGPSGVKFKKRTKPGGNKVEKFTKTVLNSVEEESSTPKRVKRSSGAGRSPGSAKSSPVVSEAKSEPKPRRSLNKQRKEEEKPRKTKKTKTKK